MKNFRAKFGRPFIKLGMFLFVTDCLVNFQTASASTTESHPTNQQPLVILYPLDEALFPPEIAPPIFRWRESPSRCDSWRISFQFQDNSPALRFAAHDTQWSPDPATWETIKRHSRLQPVQMEIAGAQSAAPGNILCRNRLSFAISSDEVGAPIFYRDVNLPFAEAVKDPSNIRWRFGSVSSTNPPPVVLEKLPVCGNCHSFSRSGDTLGMDVDYANSKGSYVITRTAPQMRLQPRDIITWDDYRREDGELTFGLLSQMSPDGRLVVSTVKDKSVFVPRPDLAFSQLFFPIKGILALYDRERRQFRSLPGADDPAYVQSNPTWSPDGQFLVFARAKAYALKYSLTHGQALLTPAECREFLKDGKPFRYDLFRIPFNGGNGGSPEPLTGASGDDRSNYFPRYSPDGKWIVFCKAANYMLLQPDSALYIIPSAGGPARRLRCNLARMNSWHSWSPNGKWLVFSSKGFSDFTQLFLTHIDELGNSTPPVLLDRFTTTNRAANIPEFVNLPPTSLVHIEEEFLDDYSYVRAGNAFLRANDPDNAIIQYRKALDLNPTNSTAHEKLGMVLYHSKNLSQEGAQHLLEALRLDPLNACAHYDLARAYLHENQIDLAIGHLSQALQILPRGLDQQYHPVAMRMDLAQALCMKERYQEAQKPLAEALTLEPSNPNAHYLLAFALVSQGQLTEPLAHYEKAVALQPAIDRSPVLHDRWSVSYAKAGLFAKAVQSAEKAWSLAQKFKQTNYATQLKQRLDFYRQQAAIFPESK